MEYLLPKTAEKSGLNLAMVRLWQALYQAIVQSWADDDHKTRLLARPASTLRDYHNLDLGPNVTLQINPCYEYYIITVDHNDATKIRIQVPYIERPSQLDAIAEAQSFMENLDQVRRIAADTCAGFAEANGCPREGAFQVDGFNEIADCK